MTFNIDSIPMGSNPTQYLFGSEYSSSRPTLTSNFCERQFTKIISEAPAIGFVGTAVSWIRANTPRVTYVAAGTASLIFCALYIIHRARRQNDADAQRIVLEQKVAKLELDLTAEKETQNSLMQENSSFSEQITNLNLEGTKLNAELENSKNTIESLQVDLERVGAENVALQGEVEFLKTSLSIALQTVEDSKKKSNFSNGTATPRQGRSVSFSSNPSANTSAYSSPVRPEQLEELRRNLAAMLNGGPDSPMSPTHSST